MNADAILAQFKHSQQPHKASASDRIPAWRSGSTVQVQSKCIRTGLYRAGVLLL